MIQYEEQREERLKKRRKKADLQGPVDIIKRSSICTIGVTKGEEEKMVQQRIFEKKKEQIENLQVWRKR